MTKKLQAWIDEIDANARAKDPVHMSLVPKPIVHVEINDDINAFVTAIPVCFDNVSIRFDGSRNSGKRDPKKFLALFEDGQFMGGVPTSGHTPLNAPECRHVTLTKPELQERLDYLKTVNDDCVLSAGDAVNGQFEVIADKGCVLTGSLENAAGASVLAMIATSRHVTVLSGLLHAMGEAEMVSVLAHELGHYYRPHVAAGSVNYNFVYDASSWNPDKRPTRQAGTDAMVKDGSEHRASFAVLQARIKDLNENVPASALNKVEGSAFHPMTLPVLYSLIQLYSTSGIGDCLSALEAKTALSDALKKSEISDAALVPYYKQGAVSRGGRI